MSNRTVAIVTAVLLLGALGLGVCGVGGFFGYRYLVRKDAEFKAEETKQAMTKAITGKTPEELREKVLRDTKRRERELVLGEAELELLEKKDLEGAAAKRLEIARLYREYGMPYEATKNLQNVIDSYSGTKAAAEAAKLKEEWK